MIEAIKTLTEEQFKFLEQELGFDKEAVLSMSEDDVYEKIYDELCIVEEVETVAALDRENEEISERGELASVIVTILGNAIDGFDNEDE